MAIRMNAAPAAAPPAMAPVLLISVGFSGTAVEEEAGVVVAAVAELEVELVVPVATDEGTVKVEPPATTIVWRPAFVRFSAGQPTPLHGLLKQHPWNVYGELRAHVHHRPPYGHE